jgi:MFS family permease
MSPADTLAGQRRNIGLLALCQGLLLTNGVTLVAVNGLVGITLASDARLATLPVTTYVLGAALATLPASFLMKHHGRRAGFMTGSTLGLLGGLLGALAVWQQSFWLLCLGTLFSGGYNAFGQQYRFAAADIADLSWKGKAISLTLAGGILGGVVGPELSKHTRDLMQPTFLATYATLAGFALLSLLLVSRLRIPALSSEQRHATGRPMSEIARQPAFIVAVLAAACGYGVMNLLMTATPIAMDMCRHPFSDAAFVLEWHVIGMFAPSFFTGGLIKRHGVLNILAVGTLLMFACVAIALAGTSVMHFWWALLLLGVGWNFLYIGGTTLLTETYRPEERAKVQGGNDFLVFAVQGITSLSSGVLITHEGWATLNYWALPALAITTIATLRWWLVRRA